MEAAKPIIIKKIKKSGHGHHGGAWKVAFADFVTAMMAFFLLMWLMGSTTSAEREAIADYFDNPNAQAGPGGASSSMIKQGAVQAELATAKKSAHAPAKSVQRDAANDRQRLQSLKTELEQAISQTDALKAFKDQLLLDITPEGLRIQIIDKENRPMFDSGSSHLKEYTSTILYQIAKIINKVPNKISLTGHTDATPFSSIRGYTNWELSTDRANASRRALVLGGLDERKIAKVVGLASTVLFDKQNPRSPMNRRISVIVMNKEAEDALHNDVLHKEERKEIHSSDAAAELIASPGHKEDSAPPVVKLPSRNDAENHTPSPQPPARKSVIDLQPITSPIQLPMKQNP